MVAQTVTYEEARKLTLAYYIELRNSLPLPMRDMPRRIVANQSLSVNAIIANIESNTDLGQWLIAEYVDGMGMAIVG